MATTRPGKLSSKFGAAFAAFEKNSGESNVPQAFRSATMRKKTTKPTGGRNAPKQNESSNEEKPKTRFSERNSFQRRSINANDVSGSKSKAEQRATQTPAEPNGAEQTQSTPNSIPSTVKRNFRVSSKLANRAKMFESSNKSNSTLPTNGNTAYQNARHGLRKVKQQPFVEKPAATESSPEPVSNTETNSNIEKDEVVTDSTDLSEDDDGSECYVEYIVKDTAHSTIGCEYSDDEYEEEWEEETVDSTEEEEEDDCSWQSWEEETIEDDGVFEEEEYLVDDKSS